MYRILAFTGLRRGELLGLKWSDIDFDKQLMTISRVLAIGIDGPVLQTPKTKSSRRTLSVDSETLKVMQMWKAMQLKRFLMHGTRYDKNDYLVFTDEKNHAIRIDRPGKVLQRIITRYDLKYIHLHGFRHTHCSLLFEAGIEMQDVKDRLGHSDIATTMNIYTHVSPEKRDHIANVFSDFMKIN